MLNTWNATLISQGAAGPTLTAAAAASMLVAATPLAGQVRYTLPANLLNVGSALRFRARGIISCAVTTPGTARFDLRFGSGVIFDSGALNLNIVAKASVPWSLDVDLVIRAVAGGTTNTTVWAQGTWSSEAVIAAALPAAGSNGILNCPVSALALTSGFDPTVSNVVDSFFTQTVATGSLTCEFAELTSLN